MAWLDSLTADTVFGWRQIRNHKKTSAGAVLSLALVMGACTAAFRLVDALLLRPLPVTSPEQLHVLVHQGIDFEGTAQTGEGWTYPLFQQMRAAVARDADLIAISYASPRDVSFDAPGQDPEKAYLAYVSGWMFRSFGLQPALGRVLTADDDKNPGAHPVAVLSYDYWTRRFGQDPNIIGRTLVLGKDVYSVIGVVRRGFTGVEPGRMTDIFVPTMMNANVSFADRYWFRTFVRARPGSPTRVVEQRLTAVYRAFREEQVKSLTGIPKRTLEGLINQKVLLKPALAGVSEMQEDYRTALTILSALVLLVLLIACVNVANLMTAQAAARAREMAVRVSLGAGRLRLLQLLLVESIMVAVSAALPGALLAWWAAPFVAARINPPDDPVRLLLPADWRVFSFLLFLTFAVTILFGLGPALQASFIQPAGALKSSSATDSRGHRRVMDALIAVQAAFGFFVVFSAGLFVLTLSRLSHQQTGFSTDRILILDAAARQAVPSSAWNAVREELLHVPGIETVALADAPLLGNSLWGGYVALNGGRPFSNPAFFLRVSPGWLATMRIPLIDGRDFRPGDVFPRTAIVNEAFAREFLTGARPLRTAFTTVLDRGRRVQIEIVGVVRNARYADLRGPMPPVAYFPFASLDIEGTPATSDSATFVVRTTGSNPLAAAPSLRVTVSHSRPDVRITNIQTQDEINARQTVRERLVATLAIFFGFVALLLSGIGLYGVIDYSVFRRRRELAIRTAIGAQAGHIARQVTRSVFVMLPAGASVGFIMGFLSTRYIETLLFHVRATEPAALAIPILTVIATALLAVMPALLHALRIDPAAVLRAE